MKILIEESVLRQALDALTNRDPYVAKDLSNDAITSLRAAIAEMEQAEPLDLRQIYRGIKGIPHPAPAVPNAPQSFTCPSCGRHTWVKE